MKLSTKLMALGAVAVLMVSGTMLALTPSTEVSASDEAPVVTVEDSTTEAATLDLNVNVMCRADGEGITLAGVNVTVYTVEMTEDENTTIVIERVSEAQTDEHGNVTFQLPAGKYVVSATYQGLRGFDWVNLTEDQANIVMLHCGDRDICGAERFQCRDGSGCEDREHWSENSTCCREHNCTVRDENLGPGQDDNCTAQPYMALCWDSIGVMLK